MELKVLQLAQASAANAKALELWTRAYATKGKGTSWPMIGQQDAVDVVHALKSAAIALAKATEQSVALEEAADSSSDWE